MEFPKVPNMMRDPKTNITYNVLAYRELSREEVVQAIRVFNSTQKKRPKRNCQIDIISSIGIND